MNLCLQPHSSLRPNFSPSTSKNKTLKHRKIPQIKNPNALFPKSNPTPLLIPQNIHPQSKLQVLQSIIADLESSVKNGVSVEDPQIFASLLESCFQLRATDYVAKIHKLIPPKLLRKNSGVSSKLLRLYACNGQIEKAHEVFDAMPNRNSSAFPWNVLISGYAEARLYEDALAMYFQMIEDGVEPDQYTYPRALKACAGIGMIQVGEEVHRHVIRYGFWNNTFVLNALVDMYSKCGDIVRARKVFDAIEGKELVSWNSMIVGYVKHGRLPEALSLLHGMIREGHNPDSVALSAVLSSLLLDKQGVEIHGWTIRQGMDWNPSISNALIRFYSNQMDLAKARWLFERIPDKDLVSWNSIIAAHSKDTLAMDYFNHMMDSSASPDDITFVLILSTCAHLGLVEEGERIFLTMVEGYGIRPSMEHYGCMVNMYGRAGMIDEAYEFVKEKIGAEEAGGSVWGALLYGCYIHANAEVGEIAAEHLFELEPEEEQNFELLVKIYEKVGRFEDAEKVRGMMVERGLYM